MLNSLFNYISSTLPLYGLLVFCFFSRGVATEENKTDAKELKNGCTNQEEFIETQHEVMIEGKLISYQATAGNLLLENEECQPKASLFFVSYTKKADKKNYPRPLTFCFNGGPGSSSVWLHLGVFGPKRVSFDDKGEALIPYRLIDNEFSLLDTTDLVFIDPVSTGYSHAIPTTDAKKFHGVEEDIKIIADFIRLYLTKYERWDSPKFIAGESYGTTRAAKLANYLHDNQFIYLNGVVLISSVLNFQSIDFAAGNDLSYLLFLPSYTATAWYHKKLAPQLQTNLQETLKTSRYFVINEYAQALFKGDLLTPLERKQVTEKLSFLTGLSKEYIDQSNLRIDMSHFAKELLRKDQKTVGRFDSRFKGIDANWVGEIAEYDPSAEVIFGPFTSTFNQYIKTELKWPFNACYKILTNVHPWNYGSENQYLNVAENLRSVMTKNPHLTVFVGNGYYDLATPFFATEYTFNHLGLNASLLKHVTMKYYEAGHMMYIHQPSLIQLKKDLASYYNETLSNFTNEDQSFH